ncbi:hypothetical protein B0H21DRAFT_823213 [Amylocystis lapponica]|nr:hypothetical protein B0H21DRAFT_823213 [Amylocystis lapponica]
MSGQSALLIGATGQVGSHILHELLASPHYTRVGEYGRRVTSAEHITAGKEKLEQRTINFDKVEDEDLRAGRWDVVFIALGTTRKNAGSEAAFEKIDREYVINSARAAKTEEPGHTQRLVYISSQGASPSSSFLYMRSKGLTEVGLAALGYHDTIILRPGLLTEVNRSESRFFESAAISIVGVLNKVSLFTSVSASIKTVAKAARITGEIGSAGIPASIPTLKAGDDKAPFTLIENQGILALANAFKAK